MQPSSVENGPTRKAPVALQLWTVREEARHDFPGRSGKPPRSAMRESSTSTRSGTAACRPARCGP